MGSILQVTIAHRLSTFGNEMFHPVYNSEIKVCKQKWNARCSIMSL